MEQSQRLVGWPTVSGLSKCAAWGAAIAAILVISGLYFSVYPYYRSEWTVDRVKAVLGSEAPVDTPRLDVMNVLRQHGISFSEPRGHNNTLNAEITGTSKFLLKEGSIFIVLKFDDADRLKSIDVDEVFTGL